jgi:hypothetical protein
MRKSFQNHIKKCQIYQIREPIALLMQQIEELRSELKRSNDTIKELQDNESKRRKIETAGCRLDGIYWDFEKRCGYLFDSAKKVAYVSIKPLSRYLEVSRLSNSSIYQSSILKDGTSFTLHVQPNELLVSATNPTNLQIDSRTLGRFIFIESVMPRMAKYYVTGKNFSDRLV